MQRHAPLRALILCVIGASLSAPAFPAVMVAESRKASSPIKIDGQADEWVSAALIRDGRSGAEIAFQNDGRNLYVLFVVKKPEALKSAESTGLTILTRAGKTKRPAKGVLFLPREASADVYILWRESQGWPMTEAAKTEVRKSVHHELFLAFAVDARGSTYGPLRRQTESDPPEFCVSRGATETTYEFRIPLESPDLIPGGIGAAPGETVQVSFNWGGAEKRSLSAKATRETPPSEKGAVSGSGGTWAQEFLDSFDALSRPSLSTKKFSFAVNVKLAETT